LLTLEIVEGESSGQVYKFEDYSVSIGRGDGNSLVLSDYHLSGNHLSIFLDTDSWVVRDLKSTNGTRCRRGGEVAAIDSRQNFESTLQTGDELLLGDPDNPVVIRVTLPPVPPSRVEDLGDRLIASRSIIDLPVVKDRVEGDPEWAIRVYSSRQPLSTRLELGALLEAVINSVFELLPAATNAAVLLRSESDSDRFTLALAREHQREEDAASTMLSLGKAAEIEGTGNVRASRAVLRRVLSDGAAILTANAAEELDSSESILGGRILSMIAVPLWRGQEITGLIQIDNRRSAGMFEERDLEVALLLGNQASLAVDNANLVSRLQVAEERLRGENTYLKRKQEEIRFENIIGTSAPMKAVLSQLEKVVDTRATVCIEGETGTGKELIASAIHYQSRRKEKMFVAQNCAALPENLLESELFGHVKGAFTSADSDKKGLFAIANEGTLFLDEVGEMPMSLQSKLLRTLQEGTIRPVGSTNEEQIDVRIVCATNRDLAKEVENGTFRQDLYYRLMVFPVRLPPLRERREDIPLLAAHFLSRYCQEYGRNLPGFSQETTDALSSYAWPGNIRELENEVQRLVIQGDEDCLLEPNHLSPQLRQVEGTLARIAPKKGTLKEMMEQLERWLLAEALRDHDNNKTRTAKTLGITREGLHKKLSKYGM
jgi:Nif-specific regulatory protein